MLNIDTSRRPRAVVVTQCHSPLPPPPPPPATSASAAAHEPAPAALSAPFALDALLTHLASGHAKSNASESVTSVPPLLVVAGSALASSLASLTPPRVPLPLLHRAPLLSLPTPTRPRQPLLRSALALALYHLTAGDAGYLQLHARALRSASSDAAMKLAPPRASTLLSRAAALLRSGAGLPPTVPMLTSALAQSSSLTDSSSSASAIYDRILTLSAVDPAPTAATASALSGTEPRVRKQRAAGPVLASLPAAATASADWVLELLERLSLVLTVAAPAVPAIAHPPPPHSGSIENKSTEQCSSSDIGVDVGSVPLQVLFLGPSWRPLLSHALSRPDTAGPARAPLTYAPAPGAAPAVAVSALAADSAEPAAVADAAAGCGTGTGADTLLAPLPGDVAPSAPLGALPLPANVSATGTGAGASTSTASSGPGGRGTAGGHMQLLAALAAAAGAATTGPIASALRESNSAQQQQQQQQMQALPAGLPRTGAMISFADSPHDPAARLVLDACARPVPQSLSAEDEVVAAGSLALPVLVLSDEPLWGPGAGAVLRAWRGRDDALVLDLGPALDATTTAAAATAMDVNTAITDALPPALAMALQGCDGCGRRGCHNACLGLSSRSEHKDTHETDMLPAFTYVAAPLSTISAPLLSDRAVRNWAPAWGWVHTGGFVPADLRGLTAMLRARAGLRAPPLVISLPAPALPRFLLTPALARALPLPPATAAVTTHAPGAPGAPGDGAAAWVLWTLLARAFMPALAQLSAPTPASGAAAPAPPLAPLGCLLLPAGPGPAAGAAPAVATADAALWAAAGARSSTPLAPMLARVLALSPDVRAALSSAGASASTSAPAPAPAPATLVRLLLRWLAAAFSGPAASADAAPLALAALSTPLLATTPSDDGAVATGGAGGALAFSAAVAVTSAAAANITSRNEPITQEFDAVALLDAVPAVPATAAAATTTTATSVAAAAAGANVGGGWRRIALYGATNSVTAAAVAADAAAVPSVWARAMYASLQLRGGGITLAGADTDNDTETATAAAAATETGVTVTGTVRLAPPELAAVSELGGSAAASAAAAAATSARVKRARTVTAAAHGHSLAMHDMEHEHDHELTLGHDRLTASVAHTTADASARRQVLGAGGLGSIRGLLCGSDSDDDSENDETRENRYGEAEDGWGTLRQAAPPFHFVGSLAAGPQSAAATVAGTSGNHQQQQQQQQQRRVGGGLLWSLLWSRAHAGALLAALTTAATEADVEGGASVSLDETALSAARAALETGDTASPPSAPLTAILAYTAANCAALATVAVKLSPGPPVATTVGSATTAPLLTLRAHVSLSVSPNSGSNRDVDVAERAGRVLRAVVWRALATAGEALEPAPRRSLLLRASVGPAAVEALGLDGAEHKDCIDV